MLCLYQQGIKAKIKQAEQDRLHAERNLVRHLRDGYDSPIDHVVQGKYEK